MNRYLSLLFILVIGSFNISHSQTFTATFQPDPAIGKDAEIVTYYGGCTGPNAVANNNVMNQNYGNLTFFTISAWTNTTNSCPLSYNRIFLSFTQLDSLSTCDSIIDATLYLYGVDPGTTYQWGSSYPTIGGPNPCLVMRVTSPWDENTVTWNTQPTTTAINQATIAASTTQWNNNSTVNITNLVNDVRASGQNNGFMIRMETETHYRSMIYYSSDDAVPSRRPKLVVTYKKKPITAPTAGNNSPICTGDQLDLTATTATPGTLTYSWTGPNGFTSTQQNPSIPVTQLADAGDYMVTYTANGCPSEPDTTTLVFKPAAPLPQLPDTLINYCQNVPADSLVAIGQNIKWFDAVSATTPLPGAPTPNTAVTGTTTWYVSQSPAGVCPSYLDSVVVNVYPYPAAPAVTATTEYCANAPFVPFTVNGQNVLWYDAATGGTGDGTDPVINTALAGTYTFYASQTTNGCESDRTPVTVTVYPLPPVPTIEAVTAYCSGNPFIPFIVNGKNILWYAAPTGGTGDVTYPVVNTNVLGTSTYYASQTINGCESDRTSVSVDVYPAVEAAFNETIFYGCGDIDTIAFDNRSTENVLYNWSFGDNTASFDADPIHQYNKSGHYTVTLISNSEYCSDTATKEIYLQSNPDGNFDKCNCKIFLADAFTPNGDGKNDLFGPINASGDGVDIKLEQLTIMNRYGQQVFATSDKTKRWDGTCNGEPLDLGTYYYYLKATCQSNSKKVVEMKGNVILIR